MHVILSQACHSECNEESLPRCTEILRFAQNDTARSKVHSTKNLYQRQANYECGAIPMLALHLNRPAVILDEPARYWQAESNAVGFCSKEWLKNSFEFTRRYSCTGIADRDFKITLLLVR